MGWGEVPLYYQCWQPDETPRATVAIVHGVGEHSGRYGNVVDYLIPRGYVLYGFDLRGHGRSPGQRGYCDSWEAFREDVRAFLSLVRQREGDRPLFLLGHSMGGIIALDYALRSSDGLRGVIASAPGIGTNTIPAYLWSLARLLNRVWPSFSINTQLDLNQISRDPAVVKEAQADPLSHTKGSPRLGMEAQATIDWIQAHAADLAVPLLIVHGTADAIALPDGSQRFAKNATYPDVELREYEGGYHELHNDIIKEQVLADVENWLARHLL